MFEKPAIPYDGRTKEVVDNVRELTRLDPKYGFRPNSSIASPA